MSFLQLPPHLEKVILENFEAHHGVRLARSSLKSSAFLDLGVPTKREVEGLANGMSHYIVDAVIEGICYHPSILGLKISFQVQKMVGDAVIYALVDIPLSHWAELIHVPKCNLFPSLCWRCLRDPLEQREALGACQAK